MLLGLSFGSLVLTVLVGLAIPLTAYAFGRRHMARTAEKKAKERERQYLLRRRDEINRFKVDEAMPDQNPLRRDRDADLAFYRIFLGGRLSMDVFSAILTKKELVDECSFLDRVAKMRHTFSVRSHRILTHHFSVEAKSRVARCVPEKGIKSYLNELATSTSSGGLQSRLSQLVPRTLFDAVERSVILRVGDVLFAHWRNITRGFISSIKAAFEQLSLEQVHQQLYEMLSDRDPTLVATLHADPPFAERWLRDESLGVVRHRGRVKSVVQSRFHIHTNTTLPEQTTHTEPTDSKEPIPEDTVRFFVLSGANEHVDLTEAETRRDESDSLAFIVTGRSCDRARRHVSLHLVASDRIERDRWILALKKFRSSADNAAKNIALVVNFFLKFMECLERRSYAELDAFVERMAHICIDKQIRGMRPSVAVSMRAVLANAVGREEWNDSAFKICTVRYSSITTHANNATVLTALIPHTHDTSHHYSLG